MARKQALYDVLHTEHQKFLNARQTDSERNLLVFPPSRFADIGQTLFANLNDGGFCTLLVSGRSDWNPQSHYYEAARIAARKGRTIVRAFLIPIRSALHDAALHEHWRLDAAAGIKVEAYMIGDLIASSELPPTQSLEFGIWDNEVACVSVRQESGSTTAQTIEWSVTKRPEDLQLFQGLRLLIEARAEKLSVGSDGAPSFRNLEEPMLVSAPLAYQLAPILCRGSQIAEDDCSWYHSIWQYLRLFNMVSTPTWHADFYFNSLTSAVRGVASPRILISGTADYSMLAHAIWALGALTSASRITVVDLCETPLLLCKWYAKFVGAPVETVNTDILRFQPTELFDVIVTDAFLTRFSAAARLKIVQKWTTMLRPGGTIITTVRIEPRMGKDVVGSTKSEVGSFRRRAKSHAQKWSDFLTLSPDQIANHAQIYAEKMVSHSCRSPDEIAAVFRASNLVPELVVEGVPGEMRSTQYARICARKADV